MKLLSVSNTKTLKKGKIKWFDLKKGYGFIEGEKDELVFLHFSEVPKEKLSSLKEGLEVRYLPELDGQVKRASQFEIA